MAMNKIFPLSRLSTSNWLLCLAAVAGLMWCQLAVAQTPAGQDAARWKSVDQHALAAPAEIEKDPATLARWLTEPFTTPQEKLRAIYRWITEHIEYDVKAYHEDRSSTEDPKLVLTSHISACEGYSNLFEELALQAGIKNVRRINGFVKDARHQKGEAFAKSNHAWNAVLIDDQWRLIDSTWGAGYDAGDRYMKRFEPMYFLANPENLRHSHFAQIPTQRFHSRTTSLDTFRDQPYIPNTLLSVVNPQLLEAPPSDLPKTFDHAPGTFWVDRAPMSAVLTAGVPVQFRLLSDTLTEFALLNNDKWTFESVGPEGSKLTIVPTVGSLVLLGNTAESANYKYLLQYEVRSTTTP
jgi:hypothetical protein